MTSIERKRWLHTAAIGFALTLLVLVADQTGVTTPLEYWLYDARARTCQFFTPKPSDRIVHLDIDDPTLDLIGAWPWPRTNVAEIVDEVRLAGARAMATDVIFPEAQRPRYEINPDGKPGKLIDDDKNLADAIRKFGRVMIPFNVTPIATPESSSLTDMMHKMLANNLEIAMPRLLSLLQDHGWPNVQLDSNFKDHYVRARRSAMFDRIFEFMKKNPKGTVAQARAELLPHTDPSVVTPATREFEHQFVLAHAMEQLLPYSQPIPDLPGAYPMIPSRDPLPPIAAFSDAAKISGYVAYLTYSDGVVRSVPMWINYRGRLYPQFALSLVCLTLGVDVRDVKIERHRVLIPRKGQPPLVIPTFDHTITATGKTYGGFVAVPWFGGEQWAFMYDWPNHRLPTQHLPVTSVWSVIETRHRIEQNDRQIDKGLHIIFSLYDKDQLKQFDASTPAIEDFAARIKFIDAAMDTAGPFAKMFTDMKPEELAEYFKSLDEHARIDNQLFLDAAKTLPKLKADTAKLVKQLASQREQLHEILAGKTVLLGWTATAVAADFVPTPLHPKCPGVVIHGTLFSGILTGEMWQPTPQWFEPLVLIMLGLLTAMVASRLSPVYGSLFAIVLAGLWVVFNGIVLFDYGNYFTNMGGPLLAIGLTWIGCTVMRYLAERAERARITRRFRSYVDPALVNFVIDNPQSASLSGEEKELTVVFTDLQGFTSLSEALGTKTIGIINEYMGRMVPIIRQHNGYVNKFLGDGIMFFFGSPRANPHHARDAVRTILDMQRALVDFNAQLTERDLPNVRMRVGVATGKMIVGDAGPPDASDYTVLGDTVNLSARLESANKATGTLMMMTQRTVEMLGDEYLVRPLARLQVVGKTEGVMVFEPVGPAADADDRQRKLVEMTRTMFDAYVAEQWQACIEAADALDAAFSPSKLTDLYRSACRGFIETPPEDFHGEIVLTSK